MIKMLKNSDLNIKEYISNSPRFEKIMWWKISKNIKLKVNNLPNEIKRLGNFITVKRLKLYNNKEKITNKIIGIKRSMMGNEMFEIKFPINLIKKEYAQLYALMVSEGSYNTEFSLNVPEDFFHSLFKQCIKNLISKECSNLIKKDYNKDFLRSRAPSIIRKIIPIPDHIPYIILNNKKLARGYLKVAFEAEGSPIFDKKQYKRYIKLSRYNDITCFVSEERLPLKKRIYVGAIKDKYPRLYEKIKNHPPKILEGEQILLKYHFGIDSKIVLEAIRKNKTDLRAGKITARWVLFIYANNINKFINQIGFISKNKLQKQKEMEKIKGNKQQYSTVEIIKKITNKNNNFYAKHFVKEMKRIGYKSPRCYLARFNNKGIIKRLRKGYYRLLT